MKLGFVTSNEGKLIELQKKMLVFGNEVLQLRIDYPEIQTPTIDEVSKFGLRWILSQMKVTSNNNSEFNNIIDHNLDLLLIEDSGLFVHGLNNFPGVYSKFVFQTIGYSGILNLLYNNSDRSAHFESCFAMVDLKQLIVPTIEHTVEENGMNGESKIEPIILFKGIVEGTITEEPRGDMGFGYDPIFQPTSSTSNKTFAEMDVDEKNNHSHRGKAMNKLIEFFKVNQ
jgi:XTP/dITP diphosphohydrolase